MQSSRRSLQLIYLILRFEHPSSIDMCTCSYIDTGNPAYAICVQVNSGRG